jgi:hypothetical protein
VKWLLLIFGPRVVMQLPVECVISPAEILPVVLPAGM